MTKVSLSTTYNKKQKKKHRKWLQTSIESSWDLRLEMNLKLPRARVLRCPLQVFSLGSFSNGSTEPVKHVICIVILENQYEYLYIFSPSFCFPLPPSSSTCPLVLHPIGQLGSWFKRLNTSTVSSKLRCFLHLRSFSNSVTQQNICDCIKRDD